MSEETVKNTKKVENATEMFSIDNIKAVLNENNAEKELIDIFSFIEERLIKSFPVAVVDFSYLMFAILEEGKNLCFTTMSQYITSMSIDRIHTAYAQEVSSRAMNVVKPGRALKYNGDIMKILQLAVEEKNSLNFNKLSSLHILLAILSSQNSEKNAKKILTNSGLSYSMLIKKLVENVSDDIKPKIEGGTIEAQAPGIKIIKFDSNASAEQFMNNMKNITQNIADMNPLIQGKKKKKNAAIESYCINLNDMVQQGKIDKLIGRDEEINKIIRILGRKKKNNVIIVGDEGVGKTAIAEGLAYKIVNKEVPMFLQNKQIISLNMTAVIAGTTLRGMFEERINELLQEIKADGKYILMIDNIGDALAERKNNDSDIAAMLSSSLESGEIRVIGTSDFKTYRSTFDKDQTLARRFQKLVIEAPSIDESIKIISGVKKTYENYHKVKYSDEIVEACVKLAATYVTDRNLPDSALDIIDETGSQYGTVVDTPELLAQRQKIQELSSVIDDYRSKDDYKTADELSAELKKLILEFLKSKENAEKYKEEHPVEITLENILDVVSSKTGIPVNQLTSDDKKKLSGLNDRLKAEIIGQDEQLDTICKAIKRNRVGLRNTGCMYSALLIARTGVGKTLTAKKLAKEIFGSEDALIRFDMSEYPDKSAVNKLIGSNPGYIGYEDGGQLTEAVKNKKYCVLLLDEIEKADKEVYNIFLQVLDEGFLTDNSGMRVDFSNVIVLFTSNVGAKKAAAMGAGIGFSDDAEQNSKSILSKALKNEFPPEFLNRLDNVIYFNSLTQENIKEIIKLELNHLVERVKNIGYIYEYDDNTVEFIFDKVKKQLEYGARPIKRAIQDNIEDKITDLILEEENIEPNHVFKVV